MWGPVAAIALILAGAGIAIGHVGSDMTQTGHTGLKFGFASMVTLQGYSRLQGAMIPRQCQVGTLLQPRSTEDVAKALKQAAEACSKSGHKLSVRASRQLYHASSDILCPDASEGVPPACSVILDMERMADIGPLHPAQQEIEVGPTVLLDTLMNHLERLGLTLDFQNLPYYSNLTVAGMLLTAAHGSSRTRPSAFGNLVRAVTFVDASGNVHITTDVSPLIGSLGLFGVVTRMVIQVTPLVKILALPRRVRDHHLRSELPKILADPDLALIQWLPDVQQAIVMTRRAVDATTPGHAAFQVLDSVPLIAAAAGPTLGINQVDNALLGDRKLFDDVPLCLAEVLLIPYHRSELTRVPIPFGVPAVGRAAAMASSNCVPGPDLGCLWRELAVNLVEVDLDVKDLPAWMDDVRRIIQRSVPTCLPSIVGFSMRFGQASAHPLDMAFQRDTVYVDILSNKAPFLVDAPSSYQHVFDEVEQLSLCKYKARAHWGKNSNRVFANSRCPVNGTEVIEALPEASKILARARECDPHGVFVGPMIRQVLDKQSLPKTAGCAVRADCYCDRDKDCGQHHACVPGETFPEFNVCKSTMLSVKHDLLERVRSAFAG